MTDMREALKRLFKQHHLGSCYPDAMEHEQDEFADAALFLMQPEIDRRVAEERAKLLEELRGPDVILIAAVRQAVKDFGTPTDILKAIAGAIQQENSDA